MIVVSDTSAISALIQIGRIELLHQLFSEVVIPVPVLRELEALAEFGYDVSWIQNASWIKVLPVSPGDLLSQLLEELDEGEAHAIALSLELKADMLIIDERKGRRSAEYLGLSYTGLGGILLRAKRFHLIESVGELLNEIESVSGFYLSSQARNIILQAAGELNRE